MANQIRQRHTAEQIFHGLQSLVTRLVGPEAPITADTRLDVYWAINGGHWWCFDMDFGAELECFFHCKIPKREWSKFSGLDIRSPDAWEREVAPRYTFGGLAEFLSELTPYVETRAVDILGKPCTPAGAFRAIQAVTRMNKRSCGDFGPSTPIGTRLRGAALRNTWDRLRWMSEGGLPELPRVFNHPQTASSVEGALIFASFAMGGVIGLAKHSLTTGIVAGVATVLAGIIACSLFERLLTRPPAGFHTFRDIALAMAAKQTSHPS